MLSKQEWIMAKSWIVVADSARARIFDAESKTCECTEIAGLVHPESRSHERDLVSDRGGRAFDSVGGGRHEMTKHVSPHEHEADLFARRIAEWLNNGHDAGEFERLQLAAPPAFLGVLRKCLDGKLQERLEKVINKNLVHETPDTIAVHFFGPRGRAKERENS
jgi:protein required for attachment to host cells